GPLIRIRRNATGPALPERIRERGIALVAVLWIVVLLSVSASALLMVMRSEGRSIATERDRIQAAAAAQAGIDLALVGLADSNGAFRMDGSSRALRLNDAEIEVRVTAESGKVDLNAADRALIRGLFEVAGAGPGLAEQLTTAIVTRREGQVDEAASG